MAAAAAQYRTLEVTLISAKDLKDVNFLSKLETYAVVSISGFPHTQQRTRTDREGRKNPTWNATFRFNIPRSSDLTQLSLEVLIRTERPLGDRDVGTVSVRLSTLKPKPADGVSDLPTFLSYPVRRPTGNWGMLCISYKFGETDAAAVSTPTAYPPSFLPPPRPPPPLVYPHHHAGMDAIAAYPVGVSAPYYYPVQQSTDFSHQPGVSVTASRELHLLNCPPSSSPYGYTPPPAYSCGYGYGSRPRERSAPPLPPTLQQQQKPEATAAAKKKGLRMGLGAGLVGGAVVGGTLVGGALSETAAAQDADYHDAGHVAGFDDSAYDF